MERTLALRLLYRIGEGVEVVGSGVCIGVEMAPSSLESSDRFASPLLLRRLVRDSSGDWSKSAFWNRVSSGKEWTGWIRCRLLRIDFLRVFIWFRVILNAEGIVFLYDHNSKSRITIVSSLIIQLKKNEPQTNMYYFFYMSELKFYSNLISKMVK